MLFDAVVILLLGLVAILFIGLRVAGVIQWSWRAVMVPVAVLGVSAVMVAAFYVTQSAGAVAWAVVIALGVVLSAYTVAQLIVGADRELTARSHHPLFTKKSSAHDGEASGHADVAARLRSGAPPSASKPPAEVVHFTLTKDETAVVRKLLSRLEEAARREGK